MKVIFEHDRAALLHGDSKDLGEVLDENSVDAIICDPPAGIAFMAKGWDRDKGGRDAWIAWLCATLAPAYRALKPGGHALVWALPRTSHWTATALENAGFEIRDIHMHIFGTGFPKSLNVSKAIDDHAGASASDEGKRWEGWGTALKPAAEHWILCRKPLASTVAANVIAHGTGGLNVDACRIGDSGGTSAVANPNYKNTVYGKGMGGQPYVEVGGRWPAHVSFDEDAAAVLDEQCDDKKGASRFFYVAKGARSEKDAGLEHLPKRSGGEATDREEGSAGLGNPRAGAGRTGGARNFHPTVKSIALMQWLVRLITPPGGTVLDPFAGSGTTGVAALAEGCSFIGCELTDDYLPILVGRIRHALGIAAQHDA